MDGRKNEEELLNMIDEGTGGGLIMMAPNILICLEETMVEKIVETMVLTMVETMVKTP